MSTTAEYSLTVAHHRDAMTGEGSTIFRFATVREFRSFQYRIDVDADLDATTRTITFRIGGVSAPSSLIPSSGTATTEIAYPGLSGKYRVMVTGARQSESFTIQIERDDLTIGATEGDGFVEVRKADK